MKEKKRIEKLLIDKGWADDFQSGALAELIMEEIKKAVREYDSKIMRLAIEKKYPINGTLFIHYVIMGGQRKKALEEMGIKEEGNENN